MSDTVCRDQGDFLGELLTTIDNGGGVIVISPSMSGGWSLDLLASGGAGAMRGFVPVAPVGIADFASANVVDDLPTLIVWGDDDGVVSIELAQDLAAALPDSELHTITDAGHAAYQDQPSAFIELLVDFAASV